MVNDGYEDVVNVDISSVVIEARQTKYSNRQQLKYIKLDARDMSPFQAGSFDAVIDKGTLDSILCGNNSRQNAAQMLEEVWRVLKDKGVYILITYGAPLYRLGLLKESCMWSIKLHVIAKFVSEGSSEQPTRELTNPVPLEERGSSVEDVLGKNPDVQLYLCLCQGSQGQGMKWQLIEEEEDLEPFAVKFFLLYVIVALVLWCLYHDTMSYSNLIWP